MDGTDNKKSKSDAIMSKTDALILIDDAITLLNNINMPETMITLIPICMFSVAFSFHFLLRQRKSFLDDFEWSFFLHNYHGKMETLSITT